MIRLAELLRRAMPPPVTPGYRRIVEDVRRQIEAGDLRPGDQLPSMTQLKAQYGVSNTVVRSAMLILQSEGLVEGHQGKGVFVREPTGEEPTCTR